MVAVCDNGMLRQWINELEIMLDDKEITQPIMILFLLRQEIENIVEQVTNLLK